MKIVFTGGGTGGHFYPLIAVAQSIMKISTERRIIEPKLYYIAPTPYDEQALFANNIAYVMSPAGRMRRYTSLSNITAPFVTALGVVWSFFALLRIYPDVVFSKGGFASVPTVIAAHLLRIPIVIHESDSKPGRANMLGSKFATHIAVTFDSSVEYFPKNVQNKIARTGIPVRELLAQTLPHGGAQELLLDSSVPTVLVLGGSSGSRRINEILLSGLSDILAFANVIHQTGKDNFAEVSSTSKVVIEKSPYKNRYHVFPFLSQEKMRDFAGVATIVVSRAGATSIMEISLWHKPAILIPIPEKISHDQRTNAYAYARTGAAVVLEEENMTPHILTSEIKRIVSDNALCTTMGEHGARFANPEAAHIIASELLRIGLSHDEENAPSTT
jgi:UDP-N-acetylglucosamine--N-acetylmuramyl-(pentapeptide) pyrophosphoryl-undecaprenol N-acetylglucosamine transferase